MDASTVKEYQETFLQPILTAKQRQGRNNKRKGNRNEYRTMRYYQAMGYWCVRSGGSLGLFDILAFGTEHCYLIQVKSNRWVSGEELRMLRDFSAPPYSRKLIVRWDDRQREPKIREVP